MAVTQAQIQRYNVSSFATTQVVSCLHSPAIRWDDERFFCDLHCPACLRGELNEQKRTLKEAGWERGRLFQGAIKRISWVFWGKTQTWQPAATYKQLLTGLTANQTESAVATTRPLKTRSDLSQDSFLVIETVPSSPKAQFVDGWMHVRGIKTSVEAVVPSQKLFELNNAIRVTAWTCALEQPDKGVGNFALACRSLRPYRQTNRT